MRVLIFIVFLLSLSSCSVNDSVSQSIYIASMGFEKNDSKYTGYFLLPSSLDVGLEKGSGKSNIAVIEGDDITSIFSDLMKTSSLKINLKHVSSIVFHQSVLKSEVLDNIINYIIKSEDLDFNFHIFTTSENIEDIYKIKNPNNESMILTILVEPIYTRYSYFTAKPIHFLNFCRDFYNGKSISIPYVELHSIWDENDLISASGITYYDDGSYASIKTDENTALFLNSYDSFEYENVIFYDYKCKINVKKMCVDISGECVFISDGDIEALNIAIKENVSSFIDKYKYLDILNFNYYGIDYSNINISVDIKIKQK